MPPAETVTALRRQRFPFHRKRSAPRLLSPRLVQTTRRAAALAGFAQGRGKLSAHAAHRVDHLVRGHDQPHARNCGVRGGWRRSAQHSRSAITFSPSRSADTPRSRLRRFREGMREAAVPRGAWRRSPRPRACSAPRPRARGSRRMALKHAAFTPRDYFLPVSFRRHAAQPPSPVSRRDAGSCLPHAAHRVDHLVREHDQPHTRKSAGFTPRDYFLPISFSRHAAQPPSPVSRRDAGSCLPHAAHRVDHLVRGHDRPHARERGVRGAWR